MAVSRSLSYHDQIRLIKIIHFMLLGAQIIFFIIAFIFKGESVSDDEVRVFDYIVPLSLLGSIFLSRIVYRSMVSKARNDVFLRKIEVYRNAVIASLAVLEAGNLISIMAFLLSAEYLYAAASLILFLLFMLNAPTDNKFRTDLELTSDETRMTE